VIDCLTISASLRRTIRRAGCDVLGRLAARPARLLLRISRAQQKAFAFATLALMSTAAFSATPPNTPISNTATATYQIGPVVSPTTIINNSTVVTNTASCIAVGVDIELLQFIPASRAAQAPLAVTESVQPAMYSTSGLTAGPFNALTNPTLLGDATPTALPANLLLSPVNDASGNPLSAYSRNEPIFVRVVSFDANLNPAIADTLVVNLSTVTGGDSELVQLTETGPSTGVFIAAVPTIFATLGSAPTLNDGQITISAHNETITGIYNHTDCTSATNIASSSSGLIDPYGIVFDSSTGAPITGATVTLVNTFTNLPAAVFCDDGVTALPQPVTTGSATICDPVMVAGGFRFPQVAAGSYHITVTPPTGYSFPSATPAASLPALVGTPASAPAIVGNPGITPGGSYGGTFTLWGPALKVDIPVDAGSNAMTISKTSGKTVVSTGDFVPYTLSITNNSATLPVIAGTVADQLPQGFRYQSGSVRVDGASTADPVISGDGRTLTFSVNIATASTTAIEYVLEVTPAAKTGNAENIAAATGISTSNTARASVYVREDLYRNKSILIGRVVDGSCDDKVDNDKNGLKNARIVLEDGTYILSDEEGRWHIDNLNPGTHVVQLDLDSLPKDYEVVSCEQNSRFAGRSYSRFVNLQPGSLWRADFHVRKKAPIAPRISQTLSAQQNGDTTVVSLLLDSATEVTAYSATVMLPEFSSFVPGSVKLNGEAIADPYYTDGTLIIRSKAHSASWQDQYTFDVEHLSRKASFKSLVRFTPPGRAAQNIPVASIKLTNHAPETTTVSANVKVEPADLRSAKTPQDDDPTQLLEKLPYDAAWLNQAQPGDEWLHPQEDFSPNLPVMSVAIKHNPAHQLALTVNGEAVNPLNFDGRKMNATKSIALSSWRGVQLVPGGNEVMLVINDKDGNEISRNTRTIHFATTPDHVEFVPELSRLIADGKNRPVIAIRFLDKDGAPVRRGINGEYMLNEPYRAYEKHEGIEREPLTGRIGGNARYEIKTDGLAMIELEPTTHSGEAVLNFQFSDKRQQEVRAWLEAGQRDWILVGFGEGTIGQKTLSGNIQALKDANADQELFEEDRLAFYAKGSIRGDYLLTIAYDTNKQTDGNLLKQAVDPTQYYTLYADATQANYDTASSGKLYVKLERSQFYAMFGDYDTGLTVTELSRYSRTLNGVKSEYKGKTFGYNAFATLTDQAYVKDEIPGNGTSGVYKLSRGNLVVNSDKIRIETRDRFQSQNIVSEQSLTRYLDYDIDYQNGTLTFREPVNVRDGSFNPIYIVAEFESADASDEKATYGGRGSFKPIEDIELGVTVVHEGTVGASGDLKGVDATYQVSDNTEVRAEMAATDRDLANVPVSGNAWLGEVMHHEEKWDAKIYLSEQEGAFGMGQQAASENATRKIGIDGRYKLSDSTELKAQAYQQQNLTNSTENRLTEGRVDTRLGSDLNAYYGARIAQDVTTTGSTAQSNQLLGGASYSMLENRLSVHGDAEVSSGSAESSMMPNRLVLGSDYKLTEQSKLFAEQEFARGENIEANTTRVGIRTQPWTGNEMSASVGSNYNKDAERIYSNLGMVQRWQINEHWQTNFSIDRSQTMHNTATPLNLNTPLPSGSGGIAQLPAASGDYTASAFSLAYHDKVWSSDGRIEFRDSSIDKQRNLQFGLQRQLDRGRVLAAGYTLRHADSTISKKRNTNLRFSYAHRPNDSQWVWFDRIDYITEYNETGTSSLNGEKVVNNLHANYMPSRKTQISMQYGAKYVLDTINNADYKGYTDLVGAEVRHDLTRRWDIGAFASMMRSVNAGVTNYGIGGSIGYKVVDNMWVSAGYNLRGMDDRDFSSASYRAQGPYVTLRMKIDQDTFGLNQGGEKIRPMNPE